MKEFTDGADILKIGFTNPLPEKRIADFIRGKKSIIVVEELDPFLEDQVYRIIAQNGLSVRVYGKRDGTLPREWEFSPDTMRKLKDIVKITEFPQAMEKTTVKLPGGHQRYVRDALTEDCSQLRRGLLERKMSSIVLI